MDKKERGRILAIDDEPDLTIYCKMALEHYGFEVKTFNDPKEALSNYKPGYHDLVILDIKMPKMDGFELYHENKKKTPTLRSVFLRVVGYIMLNSERKNIMLWIKVCLFESQ